MMIVTQQLNQLAVGVFFFFFFFFGGGWGVGGGGGGGRPATTTLTGVTIAAPLSTEEPMTKGPRQGERPWSLSYR